MRHLKFAEPHILRSSFARAQPLITASAAPTTRTGSCCGGHNVSGTGIVYVRTRGEPSRSPTFCARGRRPPPTADWGAEPVAAAGKSGSRARPRDGRHEHFRHGHRQTRRGSWCRHVRLRSKANTRSQTRRHGSGLYLTARRVASDDSDRIARRFEQEFPPLEKIKDIYERVCSSPESASATGAKRRSCSTYTTASRLFSAPTAGKAK